MLNVLLDLDGTLIHTSYRYDMASMEVLRFLQDQLYPRTFSLTDAMALLHQYQRENNNNFCLAWKLTAEELLRRAGRPGGYTVTKTGASVSDGVVRLAAKCHDVNTGIHEGNGCEDFLRRIAAIPDVQLVIVTQGNPSVQYRKIAHLKAADVIRTIHVVDDDKTPTIRQYQNTGPTIMIGNSWSHDIFPAVTAGAYAIHCALEPAYSDHTQPLSGPSVYAVQSYDGAAAIVAERAERLALKKFCQTITLPLDKQAQP